MYLAGDQEKILMVMRIGYAKYSTLVSKILLARGWGRVEDPGGHRGRQWSSFDWA